MSISGAGKVWKSFIRTFHRADDTVGERNKTSPHRVPAYNAKDISSTGRRRSWNVEKRAQTTIDDKIETSTYQFLTRLDLSSLHRRHFLLTNKSASSLRLLSNRFCRLIIENFNDLLNRSRLFCTRIRLRETAILHVSCLAQFPVLSTVNDDRAR